MHVQRRLPFVDAQKNKPNNRDTSANAANPLLKEKM